MVGTFDDTVALHHNPLNLARKHTFALEFICLPAFQTTKPFTNMTFQVK